MNEWNRTVKFSSTWNKSYLPTKGMDKVFLLIEAQGGVKSRSQRAPVNVSLVLDRSGSMSGAPLDYSKKACQFVADQLNAEDLLSLVAFDHEVKTVVVHDHVRSKATIKQQIEALQSGGSTNLSGGLLEGAQYVLRAIKDGRVNRVILLSDGHANAGITDRSQLAEIAKEFRSSGIGITAMGVGQGFDEELMEGIAENGGGSFYYLDTPDRIPEIFQEELNGLLSVVAQNMKLRLEPAEGVCVTNVYGCKSEPVGEGRHAYIGDLFQNEVKAILVELAVVARNPGSHRLISLAWDYTDVMEGAVLCSYKQDVMAEFTTAVSLLQLEENLHVRKHIELNESAKAIEKAMIALDQGDVNTGKKILMEQAEHMQAMSVQMESQVLAEESNILFSRLENFDYSSKTRKELHAQKYRQKKHKLE